MKYERGKETRLEVVNNPYYKKSPIFQNYANNLKYYKFKDYLNSTDPNRVKKDLLATLKRQKRYDNEYELSFKAKVIYSNKTKSDPMWWTIYDGNANSDKYVNHRHITDLASYAKDKILNGSVILCRWYFKSGYRITNFRPINKPFKMKSTNIPKSLLESKKAPSN